MADDLTEFKQRLLDFAKLAVTRAEKIETEAGTNLQLVQPFLTLLGYDVTNPDEVSPEHHADYSKKYPNKVDFAILRDGLPIIAIESKRVGGLLKDDLGQLKSYFHASNSVTLGVLTDGLRYEFYAASDKENIMDDVAFLKINFTEIDTMGNIDDNLLRGISEIRKGSFNPENIGAEAKRKLLIDSIVQTLKNFKENPSDELVHFFLSHGDTGNLIGLKVTKRVIEKHRQDVRQAVDNFVAQEALARLGYAPKDVVKAPVEPTEPTVQSNEDNEADDKVAPSEAELAVFTHARDRLYFLVRSEVLFAEVRKVQYRKSAGTFRVFYERPTAGALFNFRETKDQKYALRFPALDNKEITVDDLTEADEPLLQVFTQRVRERGISFETPPIPLRAISGGQVG